MRTFPCCSYRFFLIVVGFASIMIYIFSALRATVKSLSKRIAWMKFAKCPIENTIVLAGDGNGKKEQGFVWKIAKFRYGKFMRADLMLMDVSHFTDADGITNNFYIFRLNYYL